MQTLLLLHGAVGSKSQFSELEIHLAGKFKTQSFDFSGHGGMPFSGEPFSIKLFAGEVLDYISTLPLAPGERINIFGYSMGGYVAMYLAKHHPEKIRAVSTLATKFYWDQEVAEKECKMLDAGKMESKLPAFAKLLAARHAPNDWKKVLELTAGMLRGLGENNAMRPDDYTGINLPVLIMLGDRDKMVSLDETVAVYRQLTTASLSVLPGTPHPLEQVDVEMLKYHLVHFLSLSEL